MPKKSLAMLMALSGPKSRNGDGVTGQSDSTAPDQGGDAMSIMGDEDGDEMEVEEVSEEKSPYCFTLPDGFKAEASSDGTVNTTVRGKIVGDQFEVEAIGGMPVKPRAEVAEEVVEEAPEEGSYAQKRAEEMTAKKVFQS